MRVLLLSILLLGVCARGLAVNVTVCVTDEKASAVFADIMDQTGMNFVYSTDLLSGVKVSVCASDKPLKVALAQMFRGTDIEYKIKGKDVILKRKKQGVHHAVAAKPAVAATPNAETPRMLEEVVVVSRLEAPVTDTPEIGAKKISSADVVATPVLFGESDVIKSLTMQPGISEGTEGMAGMNVHGGGVDQNLYMLDNVPMYQVNHFGGFFSAFNAEAIRYADFYKSSMPAKYDGRLSSFMDVRTKVGSSESHHGTARLGLTSGSFNINGPMGRRFTYSVALRRTWFDVLTIPYVAIYNSDSNSDKIRFKYAFMDFNGKVNYRISERASGFVSTYFGHDVLNSGEKDYQEGDNWWRSDDRYDMSWGNALVQAGLDYRFTPALTAEFSAAFTRYFMTMKGSELYAEEACTTNTLQNSDNNITDWIFRGDFTSDLSCSQRLRYGANYTRHSFLPQRTIKEYIVNRTATKSGDYTTPYRANEVGIYVEDDWKASDHIHANVGFHGTAFNIDGKTSVGYAPRLSVSYTPSSNLAIKAAYSRTNQFVHQLSHTYLSLPTDQWIPITGNFKPESADKVSLGAYWTSSDNQFVASAEGYYKAMHNLVDYRDDYYIYSPLDMWTAQLCSGCGSAKGVDVKVEKCFGKLSGHIAYSLAWADRTFADKNQGKSFPARFDNRHTINILIYWNIGKKVQLNVAWTGHSGNRFTLLPQEFVAPDFDNDYNRDSAPLQAPVNNYRLPFYHRLDMSLMVRNSRGYWTFGLYNAYCHRNVIGIRRGDKKVEYFAPGSYRADYVPVFQKISILPIIPSISYTWQF